LATDENNLGKINERPQTSGPNNNLTITSGK
jgi:hypothetical protein